MSIKVYNFKEMKRIVERNGFKLLRIKGDHFYYKKEGYPLLNLSFGANRMVWQRLVKEFNLDLNA